MEKKYNVSANCIGMVEEDIIDTILNNRGVKDVEHFLHPVEEDILQLDALKNIDDAYLLYRNTIDNNGKIAIFADTDTDGITSAAIITRYTQEVQSYECDCYINDGKAHGLVGQDLERFRNYDLLIIVDSLDANADNYIKLKTLYGVQNIIIFDHHDINKNINYDEVVTLVSSQRDYPNKDLSGAGVAYKFICYCEDQESIDLSQAEQYSDLCACGLLADVMDVGETNYENRYLVSLGLNNLNNPGLKKILGGYQFNSKAVLFSIAPLINASVRVGKSYLGMNLLLHDDNKVLLELKKELEACKEIQNEEKNRLLPIVREQFSNQIGTLKFAIIDTRYGVSGLIGNTVLEEYKCPILILNDCGDRYMGSMRSVGYGDLAALINETELAETHGHPEAAGFECKKEDFDQFLFVMNTMLKNVETTTSTEINVDAEISVTDITRRLSDLTAIVNKISGKGFQPINYKVSDINEYGISSWGKGKHLLINPSEYVSFIEWNTKANFDEMDEHALMGDNISAIGQLEGGFVGRKYLLKMIMDDYTIE